MQESASAISILLMMNFVVLTGLTSQHPGVEPRCHRSLSPESLKLIHEAANKQRNFLSEQVGCGCE